MDEFEQLAKGILRKDERKVVIESDKVVLFLEQEQEYEKEAVKKMLEQWRNRKQEYEEWLAHYDKKVDDAKKELRKQLAFQKQKIETDLRYLEEGIALWSKPEHDVQD